MARKYCARHPERARSRYPQRKAQNGGADRYGTYRDGVQQTPDILLKAPKGHDKVPT